MIRIASGWPYAGVIPELLGNYNLGACQDFDEARRLVCREQARWIYSAVGTLTLVGMNYALKHLELEISRTPWIEMPEGNE